MRARNIKPGFFKSEGLASCSFQARLLFIGLWCMADREGKLEDRPLRIKAELFPYDNVNIDKLLDEIASKKDCDGTPSFIVRYGEPKRYLQILHFLSHQNPHVKEQESVIPDFTPCPVQEPCNNGSSLEVAGLIPESLLLNPDIPIIVQAQYSQLEQAINDFKEMRKKIKAPLTDKAEILLRKKLDKLARTQGEQAEILNQSTMNCWRGVWELKDRQSLQPTKAKGYIE